MTTIATAALTIAPLPVPSTVDAPDAGPFRRMVDLANEVCRFDTGHADLDQDVSEALGLWHDTADWTHIGFTAARGDVIIGVISLQMANDPDSTTAEFELLVDPAHRETGVEQELLAIAERGALGAGRTTVQTWTLHRPDLSGERIVPPTGFGSVGAGDHPVAHLRTAGYTLEQVERTSAFDLHGSFAVVEEALASAVAAAGADYRTVTWTSPTPEEHLDAFAYVISRMSTDAPVGGLVAEEQKWDAARVRRRDARLQAQGLSVSVAAVEHVPTGAIVAYNELVIAAGAGEVTHQYGTLVLKEHRGHRLGTIVKCANLLRWRGLRPDSPRVSTFNAEENRPMLDINEALGFTPRSYAGAWQKSLTAQP